MGNATLSEPVAVDEKRFVAVVRRVAEKTRLLRPRCSVELGHVASGPDPPGLWLRNRKVGS